MIQSFFLFREPHTKILKGGCSNHVTPGFSPGGFYIYPFIAEDTCRDYTILSECREGDDLISLLPEDTDNLQILSNHTQPDSTKRIEHNNAVSTIIESLGDLKMNKDITGKVVSARILKIKSDINPRNVFLRLLSTFEDAYIFCFYTPQTGMWLGATPELLLKSDKGIYLTMALAGTRNVGVSDKWDNKNIEEQRLVKEYIAKCLDKTGYNIIIGEQYTKRAGKIEHICNDIYAYPQQKRKLEPKEIETLLKELSPTPALGGFPKEFALNMIKRTENFNRAYYGGFMGYVKDTETFSLYVNLRSGNVSQKELILFAGGGITLDSVPEKEWDETERKLSTLGEILSVIQK